MARSSFLAFSKHHHISPSPTHSLQINLIVEGWVQNANPLFALRLPLLLLFGQIAEGIYEKLGGRDKEAFLRRQNAMGICAENRIINRL